MAFSTDNCKKLLQDSFPNIDQKNWKRTSKKKDVNGDVLREFLNKTDNSTILVRETLDTLSIEGYNFKLTNTSQLNTTPSQTIKGYYEFDLDPDTGEKNGSILLVTKQYWEENGVLDDRGLSHQMDIPDVLDEIQESVFLYECTEQEVRDSLHQMGFIENQLFGEEITNNTQNNTPTAMPYSDFIDAYMDYSHTSEFRDLLKSCNHVLKHTEKLQQLSKNNLHKTITFNDYKDLNEKVTHLLMYNVYHKDYFVQLQKEHQYIGSETYYQYCKTNKIDLLYLFLHSISGSLSIVDGKNTEHFIINQNKEALFKGTTETTTNFLVKTLQNIITHTQKDGLNSEKYDVLYEHFNHQTQYMIQTFFPEKMKRFKNDNLELASLEMSLNLFKTITEDILKTKPMQFCGKMKM